MEMTEITTPQRIALRSAFRQPARAVGNASRSKSLFELLRYAANCGLVLAAKLLLTCLLVRWLNASLAYFVVHVIIFFVSYSLHSAVTFKVGFSWSNLRKYFAAVAIFKLLDYALFNAAFATLGVTAAWCVLAASFVDFILRFVVTRYVLRATWKVDSLELEKNGN